MNFASFKLATTLMVLLVSINTSIAQDTNIDNTSNNPSIELQSKATKVQLSKNTLFAEVAVNRTASFYSFNYDQILLTTPNVQLSSRIGFGLSSAVFNGDVDPIIPLEVNLLIGKNQHKLETGLGVMAGIGFDETNESLHTAINHEVNQEVPSHGISTTQSTTHVWQYTPEKEYNTLSMNTRIGYRYQNTDKGGLFFKAALVPSINVYSKANPLKASMGAALSLGYTFKYKAKTLPVLFYN